MSNNEGRKTKKVHWESSWRLPIKGRLPSKLNVGILNSMRLLKKYVRPNIRYIEIGCAPGKMLAWVASELKAEVSGLDYSELGVNKCRYLFDTLGLKCNLYHEDFFSHNLPLASFDMVSSFGVIEHFNDPRLVVQRHLDLAKPGGLVLITVPNYGGIYGSLQRWCDAKNLALHNLEIMNPSALVALADQPEVESVRAYFFGSVSPWVINFDKRMSKIVATFISLIVNTIGLMQFITINAVAPMLVLEIRKKLHV